MLSGGSNEKQKYTRVENHKSTLNDPSRKKIKYKRNDKKVGQSMSMFKVCLASSYVALF